MSSNSLYIVLMRTNTIISKMIHLFKRDEYTHAAISLDRELNHMYSFGRKQIYNPFIGRFNRERLDQGVYRLCPILPGVVIRVDVTDVQYRIAERLIEYFMTNREFYKYNYKGLVYNLFNQEAYSENRFLCSEFVYYIIKESGVADLQKPANLVRPQHLLDVSSDIVYAGDLKNYIYQSGYELLEA